MGQTISWEGSPSSISVTSVTPIIRVLKVPINDAQFLHIAQFGIKKS